MNSANINVRRMVDVNSPDFYPTPEWATYALIDNEEFIGTIREPACGDGQMSRILELTGNKVLSSDMYERGYGNTGTDFLKTRDYHDNIITNPPFNIAEEFIRHALNRNNFKVAMLLRLSFLESVGRYNLFTENPPARVWIFSERITFYHSGIQTGGSGTIAYAWFVWEKGCKGNTELKWIPPGYKRMKKFIPIQRTLKP